MELRIWPFVTCCKSNPSLKAKHLHCPLTVYLLFPISVPERMIGEIELEAIREGRNLSDFTYGCVGYSIYLDDKGNPGGKQEKRAQVQLPICVGVEVMTG
jgi:hypothetical protein